MNSDQLRAFVDGVAIPLEEIGPPAMNYGQLRRWSEFKRVRYEYRMAAPHSICFQNQFHKKMSGPSQRRARRAV